MYGNRWNNDSANREKETNVLPVANWDTEDRKRHGKYTD
jgi:hypothetical protein